MAESTTSSVDDRSGAAEGHTPKRRRRPRETFRADRNERVDRVVQAIEALGRAFLVHPDNGELRLRLVQNTLRPQEYFRDIARLVFRLLFLRLATSSGLSDQTDSNEVDRWRQDLPDSMAVADAMPLSLADEDLLEATRLLTGVAPKDARDLGAIYESLLEFRAEIEFESRTLTPTLNPTGSRTHERQTKGAFYTPEPLVEHLIDSALEPVIDDRLSEAAALASAHGESVSEAQERALLQIAVCDPACGSGHFLLAAGRRLAERLANVRAGSVKPTDDARAQALRDVIEQCLYGVDIDPMAAELCRITLGIESGDPDAAHPALDRHIRVGDAILGSPKDFRRESADKDLIGPAGMADLACAIRIALGLRTAIGSKGRRKKDVSFRAGAPASALDRLGWDSSLSVEVKRALAAHRFFHWPLEFPEIVTERGGFDVVIGNPPFLNQLESATATARGAAALLRETTGGAVRGYADLAAAFLFQSARLCRPGGRVALVQPHSVLAAKDARAVRAAVLRDASLAALWIANERVFADASVYVCAPTLLKGGPRRSTVARFAGADFVRLADTTIDNDELARAETWAPLAAAASGIPEIHCRSARTLSDIATATADFRDQYYGLDGFLVEADAVPDEADANDYPPIVTSGLIDLAECRWGEVSTRILKRTWHAPRVDRRRMERDGTLGAWLTQRLVPKILVATQTKVLEAYVDADGRFVPSTPLITVVPHDPSHLWHIAAALASPVCTAIGLCRYAGTGLNANALKLSAKQVLALPLPTDEHAWNRAAHAFRAAQSSESAAARAQHLTIMAEASLDAYAIDRAERAQVLAWWHARLGSGRSPR